MNNESARELNAYRAHELARAGMNIGTILDKVLGHYDQGVVDAAASARHKVEPVKKKTKKIKKKGWLSGGVMVKYFQLMGPEGIRLATYQLTANSESASQ